MCDNTYICLCFKGDLLQQPSWPFLLASFLCSSFPLLLHPSYFDFSTASLLTWSPCTLGHSLTPVTNFSLKNCSAKIGLMPSRVEFHPQWVTNAPIALELLSQDSSIASLISVSNRNRGATRSLEWSQIVFLWLMRLPVALKICLQLVGTKRIKPKPLLRKFNDQKEENHKNLPCV